MFVYSCVALLALVQLGSSLRCYDCSGNSTTDPCATPSKHKQFNVECAPEKTACIFENITISTEPPKFIRSCGTAKSCVDMPKESNVTCITCQTDLCNSASILFPSLVSGSILIFVVKSLFNF
ncbi:hypothetical protein PPYR_12541 [Photinus pyralis]|uniref:Uncharacterized protein n=1 Tax=Photinus pyralis TaxID=7054 RepID=A0A5N4A6I1_PHOPY|nr:uncharacterized protein LOC116177591 [Photinus pyralis]KAB0792921.1 hypothetical protein PPYR_12541 [Photinus pyralis]